MESQEQEYKRIYYVDMDGVIANFDKGFEEIAGVSPKTLSNDKLWEIINTHGKAKFFSDLPWMPDGKELWTFVTQNFLRVKILTALGRSNKTDNQTTTGKKMWLRKNIPSLQDSDIIMVENKHRKRHYSTPNSIIIDDTEVVIQEWTHKGGIGILHRNTRDTISKLEQYI